ncbi:amyloid beta A4 precursor protein-binding family B member 1-interacting protein-like [Dendronephthya gigantea]|uniref:amyloid beta A4 precursor protein-binding family B member 1-interacting protein-like n=1 Tax=Dendronephthya gigantea TaxID=151771 RepID=UPI00106ACE79|nr:amyloid beta A4 precursor protein-binding family B member 1-interacting protein-like [Dendronephthya gigantea]XP_028394822.1 amyloid beta A4 precursor protein-binding family B member 1-interacting protein-like [Dendronephthya gigantea]
MDTNGYEMSTSIGSEDATSLASYYDNANSGRTSSSFEEQSDESESEHELDDHEADIDKMLMDLEGFQVELIQPDGQQVEEEPPENNEPLDEISFSMNAIEESGDVDLDALLEDLCIMEKDLQIDVKVSEPAEARSPSPSKLANSRLSSPVKVTADVKMQLEALGEELESREELTLEEQQAKFKEEKIRIAMEKLREARIKKLVIKVFNDEDPTSKTIIVDQSWTSWMVCKKMIVKYDREASTNWVLEERQPGNQLHRVLEDHECVVDVVSQWPRETDNQLVFTMRRDKYVLFKNPQNYLLSSDTHEGSARLAEQSKDTLISEFFKPDAMRLPNLDGILYLKEGRKTWKKHYFLLRASGIYYTPKGKTKNQRNLSCLVSFENTYVYTTTEFRKNQKAPTDHCFVVKPCISKDLESRQVKCLCASDAKTMQRWVTCIRVGKFGYQMLENKNNVHQEVEDLTVGTIKRQRSLSSGSSSSSELGSLQENGSRGRARSDVTDHPHRKGTIRKKEVPIQGSTTLAKLFQQAWKKGAEAEKALSPTSPPTPFSPRTAQTPHSGPKSFFVGNEKLRNLDNIREEGDTNHSNKPLVLDPAPPARRSFSNQGNNSVPRPPSPPLPPSLPPSLPNVLRIEPADTNEEEIPSPSRNGLEPPQNPPRGLTPPPPPPPLQRPDSPSFNDDFPLPPPPMLPSPNDEISPGDPRKGKPEIHFPPPPPIHANNSGPPPPPPPPPLPVNSTNF